MSAPRLHLIAPAGSCGSFFQSLGLSGTREFIHYVQRVVGDSYRVTADAELLVVEEDELRGGRTDDEPRARDIEAALGDDQVAAIISIRGGAWFTRVLPRIDFSAIDRRSRPVAVFGFSELTTLLNIVANHAQARAVHDMGPAFLVYGLRRYASQHQAAPGVNHKPPREYMEQRLKPEFENYFARVVDMIEGRSAPMIEARHVAGPAPTRDDARFIGGNLTVFSTLVGSRHGDGIEPGGRWMLLEDFNDKPERLDRFLAHLTLAGMWERCGGLLLGDFHQDDRNLQGAVLEMLKSHISPSVQLPIMVTDTVGHVWPMTPLWLNLSCSMTRIDNEGWKLSWRPEALVSV